MSTVFIVSGVEQPLPSLGGVPQSFSSFLQLVEEYAWVLRPLEGTGTGLLEQKLIAGQQDNFWFFAKSLADLAKE